MANLNVYPENMKENMNKFGGVVFSQVVLLKLVEKGLKREDAYKLVQKNALSAWNKKDGDFRKNILQDKEVMKNLTEKELSECFNPERHLKHVDAIFEKVLGKSVEKNTKKEPLYM